MLGTWKEQLTNNELQNRIIEQNYTQKISVTDMEWSYPIYSAIQHHHKNTKPQFKWVK